MDAETFLGAILIAAWAAVVVRGLEQTAVAARKGRKWERAYLVGLGSPANAGTKNRWQAVTRAPTSREEKRGGVTCARGCRAAWKQDKAVDVCEAPLNKARGRS